MPPHAPPHYFRLGAVCGNSICCKGLASGFPSELTSLFCFEAGAPPGFIGPGKTDQSGHGVSGGGNSEGKAESAERIAHSEGRERQTGIQHTFTLKTRSWWFLLCSCSKQVSELESEKQHLSEAVASLQERAQSNNEERVREVEAENRLLLQNITDTSARLASLETQLKLATEEAARLKEKAERCEEVEREAARLERSKDALSREVGEKCLRSQFSLCRNTFVVQ